MNIYSTTKTYCQNLTIQFTVSVCEESFSPATWSTKRCTDSTVGTIVFLKIQNLLVIHTCVVKIYTRFCPGCMRLAGQLFG